ncbi:MAG: carboxy terminal-processing peptidase [Verrucomicrobiota bacterium]
MPKKIITLTTALSLTLIFTCSAVTEPLVDQDELPVLEPSELMSQETKLVIEMLETMHFKNEEISDITFERLITEFMENLDFNKLYFTSQDRDHFIDQHARRLSNDLRFYGKLDASFEIYEVYRQIALKRTQWVFEKLAEDWNFETDDEYTFDRTESDWPSSIEEADALWTQRLKYEILRELLNEKTIEEAREHITKRYERMVRSIKEFGPADVQEVFLTSLTQMFDPHSTFFSSKTYEDFSITMRLSLVGIGAMLQEEDGYCVIKELINGGPAKLSNQLGPNDRIVAVAQEGKEAEDIVGMSLRKVVDRIRGEKGTTVTLTIIPADAPDSVTKEVAIVRDTVRIDTSRATAQIHHIPMENGDSVPIGVIDVPSFYGSEDIDENGNRVITSVTADVEEHILNMKDAGVQGIVLDFRRNGGGLLDEATKMTGLFIPRGPVVQVKAADGTIWPLSDRDPKVTYNGPLMVLTSRYSASASEIVAGALQNYGRAIIIGNDSTHGKGTVQQVVSLEEYVISRLVSKSKAGAAKLTVRKFYLPNGSSTQRKGVVPDITLPSIEEIMATGEAELDNALAWDYIKPARRFVEMKLKSSFIDKLKAQSEDRQQELDEFAFLNKRMSWYQEREDRTSISLNIEKRKTLMDTDEAFLDAMKDEQRTLAETNYETTELELKSLGATEEEEEVAAIEEAEHESSEEVAASEDAESEEGTELAAKDEEEEEPVPAFDIQLRESLRILVNAIEESPNPSDWRQPAIPIASKTTFEQLIN